MFRTVVIFMLKYYIFDPEDDGRRWHYDSSQCQHLFPTRNDVMPQNTWIFINIAVRISDLATRRFIAKFTRAPNFFLFRGLMNPIHSLSSYAFKTHFNIIIPYARRSSNWPLFLIFPPHQSLYPFLFAAYPTHLILDYVFPLLIFVEEYKPYNSSVCNYLKPPLTSSTLGLNISLDLLFSTKLSLCPSLIVRPQASIPYKTTGRIIVRYIWIWLFSERKREEKGVWTEW